MQKYINKIIDGKSAFGKDLKYVVALTLLLGMTYSLPQVQAAVQNQEGNDPLAQSAASFLSGFSFFGGPSSSSTPIGSTTMPVRPRPQQGGQGQSGTNGQGQNGDQDHGRPIPPEQVIMALYNAGILTSSNIDQARQVIMALQQNQGGNGGCAPMGSTTPISGSIGTTTPPCRPMPPMGMGSSTGMMQPMMNGGQQGQGQPGMGNGQSGQQFNGQQQGGQQQRGGGPGPSGFGGSNGGGPGPSQY